MGVGTPQKIPFLLILHCILVYPHRVPKFIIASLFQCPIICFLAQGFSLLMTPLYMSSTPLKSLHSKRIKSHRILSFNPAGQPHSHHGCYMLLQHVTTIALHHRFSHQVLYEVRQPSWPQEQRFVEDRNGPAGQVIAFLEAKGPLADEVSKLPNM